MCSLPSWIEPETEKILLFGGEKQGALANNKKEMEGIWSGTVLYTEMAESRVQ